MAFVQKTQDYDIDSFSWPQPSPNKLIIINMSSSEQKIYMVYVDRQFVRNTFCDAKILIRQ